MNKETLDKIRQLVGGDNLAASPEDLQCYSYDATGREFLPEAVAFPGSTEEVAGIMRLANELQFPVVPRGAGSGMTGGALAVQGGLVLVMSRFNRILEIDRENQVAVVEPGVVTGRFQAAVREVGLFYPPDPASLNFSTLGGNVANCAGGPSAVKYGVTRDYVLGLEVVLPSGMIIHTGVRTAKGVVGYDLTRLFVGSEGTLGIITKIIFRLLAWPIARETFQVLTDSLDRAAALVSEILQAGILPSTLEYMDRTTLRVVDGFLPGRIPTAAEALLLIEVDGDPETAALQGTKLKRFLAGRDGIVAVRQAANQEDVAGLWQARRSISPATFRLKPHKIGEDVVVPRSRIPELVRFTEQLAVETGLPVLTFGHAGDGNIHVNIMLDRDKPMELQQAEQARRRLFDRVLELGGTMSGEHGVGITKAPFLALELDEGSIALMRRIKTTFDPNNILNPGKMFPEVGR